MDVAGYIDNLMNYVSKSPLYQDKGFLEINEIYNDLELLRSKIEQPLHVAIIGEVKAGKSTLINAFACGEVAPTNATETTACIMKIAYAKNEWAKIHFKNGTEQTGDISQIYGILRQHENDQAFFSQCEFAEIGKNLSGLRNMYLIDTPGLETITEENATRTESYFQNVDVVLWVFNGNYLGQSDVNNRLRQVAKMGKPIVAVINRIDQVDGDPEELVDYLDMTLGIYLKKIFPLSAKKAYEGVISNNKKLQEESGFSALYRYLDENIDRQVAIVQMESIQASAKVLDEKIQVFHRQVLEHIEQKIQTYMDIEEQIQYNGQLLKQKIISMAKDWLYHRFLTKAEQSLHAQINATGVLSSSKQDFGSIINSTLSESQIHSEIEDFSREIQISIREEWNGRLAAIDEKLIGIYLQERQQNELEMKKLCAKLEADGGDDSMKNSLLAAGAAGGVLSIYSAVLAPAAAHITMGSALGAIMPPVLLVGVAVGVVNAYSKGKKIKNQRKQAVSNIIDQIREKTSGILLPSLMESLDIICTTTKEEAKRDFVEKNFAGRSVDELQSLVMDLRQITQGNSKIGYLNKK